MTQQHIVHASIQTEGLTLFYSRTGQSAKPPVILLHGLTNNSTTWLRFARDLQQDYDLILIDLPGHGRSRDLGSSFSASVLSSSIIELIKQLELERPILLGHSLGAYIAATVAATIPEQVRSLVLEDPPWILATAATERGEKPPSRELPGVRQSFELKKLSPEERLSTVRREHPTWSEEELIAWLDAKIQFNSSLLPHLGPENPFPSWQELAPRITCPVLLLLGDLKLGAITSPEIAYEAARSWQDSQIVQIPDASHNIRRDQYSHYLDAVVSFLRTH
ncbi:alpha/beta fold hydrolase [Tengunoibacter tsumagoiensis]|uniref:AB hydrolase-1 domain-containing protein n=1 Tax=Tengunoibacter tsumagoiensis TaxID=2014871 RepID=A0A402A6Y8_9CHLR|nr:alpha/beta hydrolase [Tengunoibacter tsumagoiensis]GCE14795.1 hypothetical protein KTT_46540 [Tengunoibacter tsumagoiensis]